jgi:serine/threonine protein kinase
MIGKVLKGLYKVYDEIGSGGLATVYLARNMQTNQIVAVKVLHAHVATDPDTRVRFQREADLLGGLDDPHFVRLFDHGQEGTQPFLVMEFIEGSTLKALIKAKGKLSSDQALCIARQIAEGLASIHRRGVIHRDIKPQNIMVRPDGTVKVMDFGIAKSVDTGTLTGAGLMIGTPHYISPEQAMGKKVDQRADIYSLGVVLYEMLTGQLLFAGDSPVSVLMKHLHDPVPSDWAQQHSIPPAVAGLVNCCLAKDPAKRYKNAEELIGDIDQLARSQGVNLNVGTDLGLLAASQTDFETVREADTFVTPDAPIQVEQLMPHPPQRADTFSPPHPPPPAVSPPAAAPSARGFPWATVLIGAGILLVLFLVVLVLAYVALKDNSNRISQRGFSTPVSLPAVTPTKVAGGGVASVKPTDTLIPLVVATPTLSPVKATATTPPTLAPPPLPPPITPTPTTVDMGFIELRVQPAQAGLWALVQWQDGPGNWNNVDGWWSALRGGIQVWEVFPPQFGTGPFRWVIYQGNNGPVLETSDAFYLPRSVGETIRVDVNLSPPNQPPVIQGMSADSPQVEVNSTVNVRCVAVDPDGEALSYQWTASQGSIDGNGSHVTYHAPGMPGVYPITVSVSDSRGGTTEGRVDVQVIESVVPPGVKEPEGKFGKVWHEDGTIPPNLGWALEDERAPGMAREEFEHGKLLYLGDEKRIYVLRPDGRWWGFDDTWSSSLPEEDPLLVPPPGLFQPRFGIGKVWREQLRGTSLDPGWATEAERGYIGAAMRFERGFMLWTDERLIYVLADDGTWKVAQDTF